MVAQEEDEEEGGSERRKAGCLEGRQGGESMGEDGRRKQLNGQPSR